MIERKESGSYNKSEMDAFFFTLKPYLSTKKLLLS